jgi:hypothetical protein
VEALVEQINQRTKLAGAFREAARVHKFWLIVAPTSMTTSLLTSIFLRRK